MGNKLENEKILAAFPAGLKEDVEKVLEILPLNNHNVLLIDGKIHKVDNLIHSVEQLVQLDAEVLKIPCRLYFNEPTLEQQGKLTEIQEAILNCIYLRHHNGFIRQRRLEKLIEKTDYFVVPFVFQLLGEYVMEILSILKKHIDLNVDNYVKFINENNRYWKQTESRMISYWNEYYRPRFPLLKDYIGKKIVDEIKK
jgi:hypothetical protein